MPKSMKVKPGEEHSRNVGLGRRWHDWLWQEDGTIDCDNVGTKGSPLMVPAATVSLQMSSRRTKAIPSQGKINGISNNMYRLEHCMHLESPKARLSMVCTVCIRVLTCYLHIAGEYCWEGN